MSPKESPSPISTLGIIIWGLAALFFLYEFFLRTFVGSVAHQVIPDLKLNAETFAILGSAYYVAYGVMQIPVGILADKFGVKIIMVFATLVCAGATFLFASSTNFTSALYSRFLMGFGSSFAFVCLLVIANTWFPKKFFGFFAGLSQFIGTMGPLLAAGPLIAIMHHYHETWRLTLGQIGTFGIVLAVLILFIVRNKPRGSEQALIFLKQSEPLSERLIRLATNKQAWCVAIYSAAAYVPLDFLGAVWGTEYLQARGLTQGSAANVISLAWLGYAIGCPMLGAISDIARRRRPALILCAILGLFATVLITFAPLHNAKFIYGFLFFTLGLAGAGQNIGFATITEHVDLGARATALGLNNGAITILAAIIPPLASYFIYISSSGASTGLKPGNFIEGFSILPILYIAAIIFSWFFIKETFCKPQKESIMLKY